MSSISENKRLVRAFPFLLPRNKGTDKVNKDYDYSYTELDAMPEGWRKAFGEHLCKELKDELVRTNRLDDYRIIQIKEKWGYLHWYDFAGTDKTAEILSEYENLSKHTCVVCGDTHADMHTKDYFVPYCRKCYEKKYPGGA